MTLHALTAASLVTGAPVLGPRMQFKTLKPVSMRSRKSRKDTKLKGKRWGVRVKVKVMAQVVLGLEIKRPETLAWPLDDARWDALIEEGLGEIIETAMMSPKKS